MTADLYTRQFMPLPEDATYIDRRDYLNFEDGPMKQRIEQMNKRLSAGVPPPTVVPTSVEERVAWIEHVVQEMNQSINQLAKVVAHLAAFVDNKLGPIPEPDWDG